MAIKIPTEFRYSMASKDVECFEQTVLMIRFLKWSDFGDIGR